MRVDLLLNVLPIMGYGMLGIFIVTGIISAFVDNVATGCCHSGGRYHCHHAGLRSGHDLYGFLLLQRQARYMGIDATPLYFGLLSGATLGGNCTPIGASANITGIGILRKEGCEVTNGDFFKIGIPFTMAAVIPAYILIWILFGV